MTSTVNAVIGAGSWGTAIAIHLARLHHVVYLWGRDANEMHRWQQQRENTRYLSSITFPESLIATHGLSLTVNHAKNIILAVPSHAFRETLTAIKSYITSHHRIIWITKGLDPESHQLLHQVVAEVLGNDIPLAVLSGPSFAREVAMELPTAVTLACHQQDIAAELIKTFHSPYFRVYYSADMIGVQLGGAVKNVLAVAVGIADGLQCGANAQAALMTRGLAEMLRLGMALGAQSETLMGLSGVGDLILTCTNNQSRNRRFGFALGQGKSVENTLQEIGQVVEGIKTAAEVYQLAQQHHVEMPITEQIYKVLYQNLSTQQALRNLLMREPKAEC